MASKIGDESMAPVLRSGMVAIFSQDDNPDLALENIFSLGRKGELPLVRKVIKNDIHSDAKNQIKLGEEEGEKKFYDANPSPYT